MLAFESGLPQTIDPLGGSYAVEHLTDDLESAIWSEMEKIDARGGALVCINDGWFSAELSDAAYPLQQDISAGERLVVGVNTHRSEHQHLQVFRVNHEAERAQSESVRRMRIARDETAVQATLDRLRDDASAGKNVMPTTVEAIKAYATLGEIVTILHDVHGRWKPNTAF